MAFFLENKLGHLVLIKKMKKKYINIDNIMTRLAIVIVMSIIIIFPNG
jgi:hypothetical protein